MRPEETLVPGPALEKVVQGIQGHGYARHSHHLPGLSAQQFAKQARRDILSADKATAFRQGAREHVLFGNTKTGMSGWLNTTDPTHSTYFKPKNLERYLRNREVALEKLGQKPRRLDPPAIRAQAKAAPKPLLTAVKGQPTPKPMGSKSPPAPKPMRPKAVPPTPIPARSVPAPKPIAPRPALPAPRGPAGPRR